MATVRQPALRAYTPLALAASNVGTWEYAVPADRVRFDEVMAALFGLDAEDGKHGLPLQRFVEAVHPEDVGLFERKVARVLAHGGLYVLEYRTCPTPGALHWVLARGRFEADATGRIVSGRGICVDITENRCDEGTAGRALFLGAPGEAAPLDRAAEHAIAARKAIDEVADREGRTLRQAADALLWALGRCLARRVSDEASRASN
jgi:hypothetical protein